MASVNGCSGDDWHVRVVSRRLVKASDTSIKPHVLAVSNLDIIARIIQVTMLCVYPKPPAGDFDAVVAAFEAGLPHFLNHFFLLAGRIATNTASGLPEDPLRQPGRRARGRGRRRRPGEPGLRRGGLVAAEDPAAVRRGHGPVGADCVVPVRRLHRRLAHQPRPRRRVRAELARQRVVRVHALVGELPAAARPDHDRSIFRPRAPPSYAASLDEAFTPLDARRQVNVLTTDQSFVHRVYHINASDIARLREDASRTAAGERATRVQAVSAYIWKVLAGVVGAADSRCRMGWWVNGRRRVTARSYFGNAIAFVGREAGVQDVLRMPLPDVAAMVREAIAAPAYGELLQEMVDWVEERKPERHVLSAAIGLGSPAVIVTSFTSFRIDTDFGFGHAAMAVPTTVRTVRLCSTFMQIVERPGGDGSWIVGAFLWPRLAAALEAGEPRIFKPLTAEHLGLFAPHVPHCRL
ncbi:hypothetical protein ACP70R_004073 [Stipagrostis hirtigluma subsp. patula]